MSKSVLRRIEKVAPEALAELREQIAQEIETMQRYETMMDGTTEKYSTGELLNRDEVLQAIRGK